MERGKEHNSFLNWLSYSSCKWHDWNYQLALQNAESIFLHLWKPIWDLLSKTRGFHQRLLSGGAAPMTSHFSRALFLFQLLNSNVTGKQLHSLLRFASCYFFTNLVIMVFFKGTHIISVGSTQKSEGTRNNRAEILLPRISHLGSKCWSLINSSKNSVFIFDKIFHRNSFQLFVHSYLNLRFSIQ